MTTNAINVSFGWLGQTHLTMAVSHTLPLRGGGGVSMVDYQTWMKIHLCCRLAPCPTHSPASPIAEHTQVPQSVSHVFLQGDSGFCVYNLVHNSHHAVISIQAQRQSRCQPAEILFSRLRFIPYARFEKCDVRCIVSALDAGGRSALQFCGHKTSGMCSHRGRNGFSPHNKKAIA